jgi:hypothetical protein
VKPAGYFSSHGVPKNEPTGLDCGSVAVPVKTVFLSYASEDAPAAQRIAEVLRSAGIEVWFDQDELRGGDAWDHRIRREIHECGLFIPIISASTEARPEGYFRLEWDLADQRSHMIGRSKAFIVPVCIDRTAERGADVPDSFLKAQWVRLPAGEASKSFAPRIAGLLAGEARRGRNRRVCRRPSSRDHRSHPVGGRHWSSHP